MKVLFAVSDEKDAQAITRVYQKEYKEIITSKTVYYFNAIIKELQKDKSYDRIVISEDVEMFASDNYQAVDKFIFDKMDAISDEATNEEGNDIPIILLGMDRRTKSDPLLVKLFGLGLYNVLVGQDRSLQKVAALMYKPRTKKEAKAYYKVETEKVNYTADNKNGGVNESEIQNILTHYKKIGNNIPKCVQSFDSIASQYSKDQVKLIAQVLPNNVKVILEENSDSYRKIMGIKGKKAVGTSELRKAEYVEKEIDSGNKLTQPVIIPTAINASKTTVKKTTTAEKAEKIKESKRKEEERIAKVKAAAEAKKKEQERIAKEKAAAETKKKEEERIAKEKAEAEAKKKEQERIAKEKAEAEAKKKEEERIAKEKAAAEAKRKEEERIAKEKAAAEAKKKEEERIAKMKTDEENEVITTAKRGRGRPRKNPVEAVVLEDVPVKRRRGRPRKNPIVEEEKVEEKVVKPSKDDFEDDLLAQFDDYEDDVVEAAPKAAEAEEVNKNEVDEFDYDSFDDMNEDEFDYDLVDDEEDEEEADDDFDYSSLDEEDEDIDFDSIEKEMDETEELDSSDNNQVEEDDNYDDFEDYEEDDFDEYDDNDENETSNEDDESYEDEEFEDEDSDDFDYDLVDDELDAAEEAEEPEEAEEELEDSDEDYDLDWEDDDALPGFEDDEEETVENEDVDTVEESDEDLEDEFDDEFDDDDYDSLPGVNDEDELDDSDAEAELSNEDLDSFEDDMDDEEALPGFEDEDENETVSIDEPEEFEEESAQEEVNEIQHNGAFKGINNRNYRYDNNLANSIKDLKETEETSSYNLETDNLITSNQKIVAFVGTTKNGTSFIVNNLAEVYSNRGIKTAILDLTKNKNSYYIYTNNEDTLRDKAQNCLDKLVEGTADGVVVNKNLTVFTSLPGQDDALDDVTGIIKTLLENYTIVLLDCDFDTDVRYFRTAQEMYLVQSLDVLTIQPLTAFLRDLKVKEILETNKLRIVINKNIKVKSLTEKVLIGGMSVYNDPSMTYMTELFNKDTIKYTTVPFEDQVYVNYLEGLVNCEISLKGYSKNFISSMNRLADMAYPTIGGKNVTNNKQFEDTFSKDTSSILNKMKKKY